MAAQGGGGDVHATSRYGNSGKRYSIVRRIDDIGEDAVPGIVADMRAVFETERTYALDWRREQLKAFRRMMVECEDELCEALHQDLHRSRFEGFAVEIMQIIGEIDIALHNLTKWMKPAKKMLTAVNAPGWAYTQRDPLGVCLIMGAWNYPIMLQLAPLVGCIAGGNCAILKPGSYAHATSNKIAEIVKRYMDPDCFRVLEGGREMSTALLKERFDKVFFTGSTFVGKIVARACAEYLTPCVLELGGKCPCIVDKSANLEIAAHRAVWGKFLNAGQTCVGNDFLVVHEEVADKFLEHVKTVITKFYSEEPDKSEWFGRIVNDAAFERLAGIIESDRDKVVIGGQSDAASLYVAPTVLDFGTDFDAFKSSAAMADEIFGPIFPTYRFKDLEQIIQFVKRLPTGKPLALYAYGSDSKFIEQIKTRTTSGGLCINDSVVHLANHGLPFGGVGNSGMGGGYHGKYSFDQFTHEKAVLEKSTRLDNLPGVRSLLSVRFPPYTKEKQRVVRMVAPHWVTELVNRHVPRRVSLTSRRASAPRKEQVGVHDADL